MSASHDPKEAVQYVRAAILGKTGGVKTAPNDDLNGNASERNAMPSRYNLFIPLKNKRTLVYNTFHRSFALWDQQDLNVFNQIKVNKIRLASSELADFIPGGFIVPDQTDEMALVEKNYRAMRFNPGVMNLTIAPTLGCNFGCDYCYQGKAKPTGFMPGQVQDAIIEHLKKQAPALRRLHVSWYGGEPTLAAKTVNTLSDRMIAICQKRKVHYSAFMVTNGYALTRKLVVKFRKKQISTYQVTLDGPAEFHNRRRSLLSGGPTYERILNNLYDILDHQVPIQMMVRINIDERNRNHVHELIDDLADRGFGGQTRFRIYFAPVRASTLGCRSCSEITLRNVEYGLLETELHRHAFDRGLAYLPMPPRWLGNCQAVRPKGVIVLPNGDLHKCWDTVSESDLKVGSIFFMDKFHEGAGHRTWLDYSPMKIEMCRQCVLLPSCSGFCAYRHLFNHLTHGEAASIPCPSWRYNINERLFLRAEKRGFVSRDDWDETRSPSFAEIETLN